MELTDEEFFFFSHLFPLDFVGRLLVCPLWATLGPVLAKGALEKLLRIPRCAAEILV
uniref:Uncharacterized protein n=1 Tax=Candidozyma auris TaxID=498019 RepID=A0A0L0NZG7_CANAR